MISINLDSEFKPFLDLLSSFPDRFEFPSGCEPHVTTTPIICRKEDVLLTTRIRTMNDFFTLLLATDACKRAGASSVSCFIPYLPFARQDRVMNVGEPLSLKVIADIINLQGYKEVWLFDPHSEVSLALIDNSKVYTNHNFVEQVLRVQKDYLIVSPDAGAYKKIFKLCQHLNYKDEIVLCNKTRDVTTGNITSVFCPVEDFRGKDLYIVDDICDGGGTFILLARELRKRNCGTINLIVTHGIFSKGVEALENIDHIYTTDSFQDLPNTLKLTQVKLKDIL